jgi:beta-glucosidase
MRVPSPRFVMAALLALGLAACTKTETVVVPELPACSATVLLGTCPVSQSCFGGSCVATSSLCSQSNTSGTCSAGFACYGGGCILASAVPTPVACSVAEPNGTCAVAGESCFMGGCVPDADICSASNQAGFCPTGWSCYGGGCIISAMVPPPPPVVVAPCDVKVYTVQPVLDYAVNHGGRPTNPSAGGNAYTYNHDGNSTTPNIDVPYTAVTELTVDGLQFRDLNKNGTLEKFEDWRYSEICRAKDLAARMTVPQKVGLMSEGSTIGSGTATGDISQAVNTITVDNRRQALIRLGSITPAQYATYLNNVQALAEGLPLAIPFVVTADPVHSISTCTNGTTGAQTMCGNNGSGGPAAQVSHWPQPFGLGAINNTDATFAFGNTIRAEFMAMGFRWQLGPMADLATEPRWARVQNLFGENAHHVAKHVKAEIEGFQGGRGGGGLRNGIAATMKHFPGAGADEDGKDSHSAPGKFNVYPGGMFEYHQISFKAAIEAGSAAVMPCYSIFKVPEWDPTMVGAAHSGLLITTYLKNTLGFDGMITGDWGSAGGSAWGLELFTGAEKAASFVRAGSHQLGSDSHTLVQAAYDQGLLTEADIDGAAWKILEMTFRLGLFENPYVDPAVAATTVRSPATMQAGFDAQKKALVLIRNAGSTNPGRLPISQSRYIDVAGGTTGAPDLNEFSSDANKNGVVEVYFDGVTDGLAGTDQYSPVLLDYNYAAAGSGVAGTNGFTLPIVSTNTLVGADIAVVRITARKGAYMGLDAGVPLSFDGPLPSGSNDSTINPAIKDRNRVIDLFRVRDGYTDSTGAVIAPVNPTLKIVLVVHLDRAAIIKPFVNGLTTLDETLGVPGSYPLVSNQANVNQTIVTTGTPTAHVGVDTVVGDFGAYDRAILDFVFNRSPIAGWTYGAARLPIEIPSSDAAVDAQFEDVPADSLAPTYSLGAGSNLPAN